MEKGAPGRQVSEPRRITVLSWGRTLGWDSLSLDAPPNPSFNYCVSLGNHQSSLLLRLPFCDLEVIGPSLRQPAPVFSSNLGHIQHGAPGAVQWGRTAHQGEACAK